MRVRARVRARARARDRVRVRVKFTSSQVQLRKPGSSTEGEIDSVRFVGPTAPATRRGRCGSLEVTSCSGLGARGLRARG